MEGISEPTPTKYEQVTVEVPEERLAEFHAFFARFLGGRGRRRRHGDHGRHGHGRGRGRGCAPRHERAERGETHEGPAESPGQTLETAEL
jgi:hypothetical protein